jgi:acyl-coenzyme A thioesterase PaaI-like protein
MRMNHDARIALRPDAIPEGFVPRPVGGGFLQPLGPLYVRREDGGRSVFGLRIEPAHCNAKDMCHGGMLATLADLVLGIGGLEQVGVSGFFVTMNLTQDFLAPVPLGAWLEKGADRLHGTRGAMFVQGLFTVEGRLGLPANGVYLLPRPGV